MKSDNPDVKRLLGTEGKHGEALGLTNDWAYRIIKHVGNYGESFERNVGQGSHAEDRARPERAVDQGRPAIRAADPLSVRSVRPEGSGRMSAEEHRPAAQSAADLQSDGPQHRLSGAAVRA